MATVAEKATIVRRKRRWEGLPYWLILPTLVYLGVFFAWPMVKAFQLAFRDETGWTLDYFRTMVNDAAFNEAVRFTLLLVVVVVPLQFVIALAMALIANAKLRGRGLFLYIFLLPLAISELAAGLVWAAIFTEAGYLNTVLEKVGVIDLPYIWIDPSKRSHLLLCVVAAEIWRSTSLIMMILVAGLQGIPKDYTEAAEVFGAGFFQRIRRVTLPMLKPALQVALVLRLILSLEVFATVVAITGRGTTVLTAESWRWKTEFENANVAAAYAGLILVLSIVAAGIVLTLLRTPKEQQLR
jgi:multiple sugar transport system permease protein